MKKTLTIVLLLITSFAFSQKELSKDYDYQVSEPYRVTDARTKEYYSNGKEVLGVKVRAKTKKKFQVLLQKYNIEEMKEIGKNGYNDFPDNFIFEGVEVLKENYYFFYSSWTGKKTKHERLYVREIDFEKGTFKGEAKQIIDYDGHLVNFYNTDSGYGSMRLGYGKISFGGITKFDLRASEDESKLLIQYRKKPTVKRDTKSWDKITVSVYDNNLDELWKKNYTMPYTERRMNFMDNIVDNNGNTYMLAKVFNDDSNKDKKRRKDKKANYHIELFELNNSLDKIKKSIINIDDKFIKDIVLLQNGTNLLCAGFYSNDIESSVNGLYTFKLNNELTVIDKKYYEIPLEILNQYVSKKKKKKNSKKDKKDKAELSNLKLRDVVFYEDESISLIGEVNYIETHYMAGGNGFSSQTTVSYHYEDILMTKINANGELAWMKKVPKRQRGLKGKGGMSYTYFNANGNHYLIYLDNVKNFDLPIDKTPAMHMDGAGGYLTAVKINDKTGELVKGSILDFRKIKGKIVAYQFNTDRIVKIKDNEFFVEVYKKKKEDVFIKVEMKE